MEQSIKEFINNIRELKKEKKRPIGFITDEEDPFYDSSINKLLERMGHDEMVCNIPHDVKYYLESLLREDERRYPRVRIQCSRCGSRYVFYVEPKVRHARDSLYERLDEVSHEMAVQRMIEHFYINCVACSQRMILTDVEKIIKFEAIITNRNQSYENPEYEFRPDQIGDPFNL